MSKNSLIVLAGIMLACVCAFALHKQRSASLKAFTVVSVHTFTPNDRTKPVEFLGVNIESYKEDGSFVHRQVSAKGKSSYFYSDTDGVYRANSGATEAIKLGADWKPNTNAELEAMSAGFEKADGFKRTESIHGLPLSVIETFPQGKRYTKWMTARSGPIQWEREINEGIEQTKIVSVQDGYNTDEFARIPKLAKVGN